MGKHAKKRKAKHSPAQRADNSIRVRRVNAVVRSDFMQWMHDNKKTIRTVAIISLVVGLILFLTIQGIMAVTR